MNNQSPVVVLVHGAFAESSSWNGVLADLYAHHVEAVAVANPLRSLSGDAAYVRDAVTALARPVILVGHSYGGLVITEAAADCAEVIGLVYVSAFAPDTGESALQLSGSAPGSTLGDALISYPLRGGGTDLRIRTEMFSQQFAADVDPSLAGKMARTQRPVTEAALSEGLPTSQPAWKRLPSWFVFGGQDRNIPPAAMRAEAERAGARGVREILGASHATPVSQPGVVAETIVEAIEATTANRAA